MANGDIQDLLRSGIQAARNGNKAVARNIFEQVLEVDGDNEAAWMWYASVLDSVADRERALRQVLDINPNNVRAQEALARLRRPGVPAEGRGADWQSLARDKLSRQYEARQQRGSGFGSILYYLAAILAIGMIVVGLYQFWQETRTDDDNVIDVANITPTTILETFTPAPPTRTPLPPGITAVPLGEIPNSERGSTWTPSPEPTDPPPPSPTATLVAAESYQFVFANRANSSAPSQLIFWDGAAARFLDISIDNVNVPTGSESTEEAPSAGQGAVELLDPAVSPDGQQIAFTVQLTGNVQEIFTVSIEGGRAQQLTNLGAENTSNAAWSPDGERLAFASNSDGDLDVYLVSADGDNLTNLTDNLYEDREPAFSPDGELLVLASDRNTSGEFEIFAIPLNEGEPVQYTDAIGSSFAPSFSPDGSMIAFISNRNGDNDLFVMSADGSNERLLSLSDENADDRDPAWVPDGVRVSVSSDRNDSDGLRIWLVQVSDPDQWQQLTTEDGSQRGASWRPVQ